jgi:hypothetical protein
LILRFKKKNEKEEEKKEEKRKKGGSGVYKWGFHGGPRKKKCRSEFFWLHIDHTEEFFLNQTESITVVVILK